MAKDRNLKFDINVSLEHLLSLPGINVMWPCINEAHDDAHLSSSKPPVHMQWSTGSALKYFVTRYSIKCYI